MMVMAFDFGLKQIGIAVAQTVTRTSRPLAIITAREGQPDWTDIASLLQEWKPNLLLVGLPLNMDGSESEMSQRATKFANRLHGRFGLKVEMVDERLSSFEIKLDRKERLQYDKTITHSSLPAGDQIDAHAAALILDSWFQRL